MTAARELAVDEILVTWNEGEETPTSLLSCLKRLSGLYLRL